MISLMDGGRGLDFLFLLFKNYMRRFYIDFQYTLFFSFFQYLSFFCLCSIVRLFVFAFALSNITGPVIGASGSATGRGAKGLFF